MIGISLKERTLPAGFVQPGSCVCAGSPERSAKWGPELPKALVSLAEGRSILLFGLKKPTSSFGPRGLRAAFLFHILIRIITAAAVPSGGVPCASRFPPGPGMGLGHQVG